MLKTLEEFHCLLIFLLKSCLNKCSNLVTIEWRMYFLNWKQTDIIKKNDFRCSWYVQMSCPDKKKREYVPCFISLIFKQPLVLDKFSSRMAHAKRKQRCVLEFSFLLLGKENGLRRMNRCCFAMGEMNSKEMQTNSKYKCDWLLCLFQWKP